MTINIDHLEFTFSTKFMITCKLIKIAFQNFFINYFESQSKFNCSFAFIFIITGTYMT